MGWNEQFALPRALQPLAGADLTQTFDAMSDEEKRALVMSNPLRRDNSCRVAGCCAACRCASCAEFERQRARGEQDPNEVLEWLYRYLTCQGTFHFTSAHHLEQVLRTFTAYFVQHVDQLDFTNPTTKQLFTELWVDGGDAMACWAARRAVWRTMFDPAACVSFTAGTRDARDRALFIKACRNGKDALAAAHHESMVQEFLLQQSLIDHAKYRELKTSDFVLCAKYGLAGAMRSMLELGGEHIDVNAVDEDGVRAIEYVVHLHSQHIEALKVLLDCSELDINNAFLSPGEPLLLSALSFAPQDHLGAEANLDGNGKARDVVTVLLQGGKQRGLDINQKIVDTPGFEHPMAGWTPLLFAVHVGDVPFVRAMLALYSDTIDLGATVGIQHETALPRVAGRATTILPHETALALARRRRDEYAGYLAAGPVNVQLHNRWVEIYTEIVAMLENAITGREVSYEVVHIAGGNPEDERLAAMMENNVVVHETDGVQIRVPPELAALMGGLPGGAGELRIEAVDADEDGDESGDDAPEVTGAAARADSEPAALDCERQFPPMTPTTAASTPTAAARQTMEWPARTAVDTYGKHGEKRNDEHEYEHGAHEPEAKKCALSSWLSSLFKFERA